MNFGHAFFLLIMLLGIPGCAQGGDSPSGDRKIVISYEEDFPLDDSLSVEIFSDYTVSILEKKMKSFCEQPASNACWQETKKNLNISSEVFQRLKEFIEKENLRLLPKEVELAPGFSSIALSLSDPKLGTWEVRVSGENAPKYPAVLKFQKMLHEIINK